jgi:hypothetical protein
LLMPEDFQKVHYALTEEGERVPAKANDDLRYVYRTDVVLRQNVSLARNPSVQDMAITWSAGSVGYRRLMRLQADLMNQVDKFVETHKAANSR